MRKFNVITRENCVYCEQVKKVLFEKKIPFDEYIIGVNITREEVLQKYPTQKMLPVITDFETGELIGGYNEIMDVLFPGKKD